MALALDGRVVLVTGGSRGLGREMALALAEAGARLAITGAADSAALRATEADLAALGAETLALPADVTDPAQAEGAVAACVERFGRIDSLVNNAGLGMRLVSETFTTEPTKFWETEPATWARIIDANVNGVFYMARAAARRMVPQGSGKIITISTSEPTMVRAGFSPYGPSKAAIEAASRVWAQDLAGAGVGVFVYLPGGATDTDLLPAGPNRRGADGGLLPADIMRRGIVWLCSSRSDGRTSERYVARLWDENLAPDEAAAAARSATAPQPAIL